MDRPDYAELFSTPDDYKPPSDGELSTNTEYPNLNSKDYRKKPVDRSPKIYPFYEVLAINDEGEHILACNEIRARIWEGYIWGFQDIADVGKEDKALYKVHCQSPITNASFIRSKIFILSQADGTVQLWSTRSEGRSGKDYCLFMIGAKHEHVGVVQALDVFPTDATKIVTGSNDCCLKIWDTGAGDLVSINTLRYAHSDSITGISCYHSCDSTFTTCSRDKSALIWDNRLPQPAQALIEKHKFPFTSIYCAREDEKDYNIILGDEAGVVYSADTRMPKKFFDRVNVFNRPIRKTRFQLNQMAVIGNTNTIKVYKCTKNSTRPYELLYKDSQEKNFLRDCLWNTWAENEVYTVGWDKALTKHVVE